MLGRRERGSSRWGSPEAVRSSDVRSPPGERVGTTRPTSPEGWRGNGLADMSSLGQGLEGLLVTSPNAGGQRGFRTLHTPFAPRATEVDAASLNPRGR